MRFKDKIITIFLFFLTFLPAYSEDICKNSCNFNDFFKQTYENVLNEFTLCEESQKIFDMLFNAYSIKFRAFDLEYQDNIEKFESSDCKKCQEFHKNEMKNLQEMAIEELESFLDDLNFELCGCEESENRIINKIRKGYKRPFKKLVAKYCK